MGADRDAAPKKMGINATDSKSNIQTTGVSSLVGTETCVGGDPSSNLKSQIGISTIPGAISPATCCNCHLFFRRTSLSGQ